MEQQKRIRLVFKDDDVLSERHKASGLNRYCVLLKPEHLTVADVEAHLLQAFRLQESCPYGIFLAVDGFVLSSFECTNILRDDEVIGVHKRRDILPVEGFDAANDVGNFKGNVEVQQKSKETDVAKVVPQETKKVIPQETKKVPRVSLKRKYGKWQRSNQMADIQNQNATCELEEDLRNWKENHDKSEQEKGDGQSKSLQQRSDAEKIEVDSQPKGLLHLKPSSQDNKGSKRKHVNEESKENPTVMRPGHIPFESIGKEKPVKQEIVPRGGTNKTRVLIAQDTSTSGKHVGKFLSLRHPRTGNMTCYLYSDGLLQELHWFKQTYGSWFLGDYVCEDGCLYIATPVDPVFILLPLFEEAGMNKGSDQGKFRRLDEIIYVHGYPGYQSLSSIAEETMQVVCDLEEVGSTKFFRLNDVKVLKWLCCKVHQLKQILPTLDKNYAARDEKDTLFDAISIVGEYLKDETWVNLLCHKLKLNLQDLQDWMNVKDSEIRPPSVDGGTPSHTPVQHVVPSKSSRKKLAKRQRLLEMKQNAPCELSEDLRNWKEDHAKSEQEKGDGQSKSLQQGSDAEVDGQPEGLLHLNLSPQDNKGRKREELNEEIRPGHNIPFELIEKGCAVNETRRTDMI